MTDTTGSELLRAICTEPDEDTHRLVYAGLLPPDGNYYNGATIMRAFAAWLAQRRSRTVLPFREFGHVRWGHEDATTQDTQGG